MRALVVYESMFGNTEEVARAVAAGVAERAEVTVSEVAGAPVPVPEDVDLIVVGGPTHAFSLSRSRTRAAAAEQGADHGEVDFGLREWLARLEGGPHQGRVAAFDTKVENARRLPGSAARKAERVAHRHGYATVGSASFYVEGTSGPLLPGEVDRAREWGRVLVGGTAGRSGSTR